MLERLRRATAGYPRPFWLLFWGMLISRAGGSMVWPFLTIYLRQRLGITLTEVGLLLTVHAVVGIAATGLAGPVVDRFGRKGAMVLSLFGGAAALLAMARIGRYDLWLLLMAFDGALSPLYRVAGDAMVADLIEPGRRPAAYALLRMIANLGVAIGPSIGGFVAAASYSLAFHIAAVAGVIFALLVLGFVPESAPRGAGAGAAAPRMAGYGPVLRDRPFLAFCACYTLASIPYAMMMVLLPVYAKEGFGVPEHQYGFIMAANAAMVVAFQYGVTRQTARFRPLPVLALGALFYALGTGSVAAGAAFTGFLFSMVVLTIGELIIIPTATALTADLAPPDMRGRYMGVYNLTWGVGFAIGPVLGGVLNDHLAPAAIWYAGLALGAASALGFLALGRALRRRPAPAVHGEI